MKAASMSENTDRKFMHEALDLAARSVGLASPNPPVGCVIVRKGGIVGRGWHEYSLLEHAEVRALREAAGRARGATAYVTLEPCCYRGRTPPCADALIQAGIARVVAARLDPNPKVSGRGIGSLRSAGVRADVGILAKEAGELIESFACHVTTGLPLVVSKIGMSLDGKIGTGRREGRQITSPESAEFTQRLRLAADALLVGAGTVLADDPLLTYRGKNPKSKPLTRVILDPSLDTPPTARLFRSVPASPLILFCARGAARDRRVKLEDLGAEIIPVRCRAGEIGIEAVLKELGKRNVLGLLVEGGSRIHWSFLSGKFVDKFYFIVAPLVLGGKNAIPSVGGKGYKSAADSPKFKLRGFFNIGPDLVLETYPVYSRSILSPWRAAENAPSRGRCLSPSLKPK